MTGGDDFIRLAAVGLTSALFVGAIIKPNGGRELVERAASAASSIETLAYSDKPCAIGEPAFSSGFTTLDNVLSVSPLGGVTAPGETLPAPYIRINTRRGENAFERRNTNALAPARAEIIALERKTDRDDEGRVQKQNWTVHFSVCENVNFYYDQLDELSDDILRRVGGLKDFVELGGPDHIALETRLKVSNGEVIGVTDGFDIGLHDKAAPAATLERPERYATNTYARAAVFDASPSLMSAITPNTPQARCPIDYLPKDKRDEWAQKLGDSWGIRKAKGDNVCRTAITDLPNAAQGVWYTDSAHNAATTKVSAVALAADTINPKRLIFSLHGRLPSLSADMVALPPFMTTERAKAANDFLTFEVGDGRINTSFADVRNNNLYCYDNLRVNFVGPEITGVIVLERQSGEAGPALLKIEARDDAYSCIDLEEPWSFAGNETTFYR